MIVSGGVKYFEARDVRPSKSNRLFVASDYVTNLSDALINKPGYLDFPTKADQLLGQGIFLI